LFRAELTSIKRRLTAGSEEASLRYESSPCRKYPTENPPRRGTTFDSERNQPKERYLLIPKKTNIDEEAM